MGTRLRGVLTEHYNGRHTYQWRVRGAVWQWATRPRRKLYRNGVCFSSLIDPWSVLCLDDAVVLSLGYEMGYMHALGCPTDERPEHSGC